MKPFDLDTLLNLKDLEIAQLAHNLRPIFGLVIYLSPQSYMKIKNGDDNRIGKIFDFSQKYVMLRQTFNDENIYGDDDEDKLYMNVHILPPT